jgi:hypothetical protein
MSENVVEDISNLVAEKPVSLFLPVTRDEDDFTYPSTPKNVERVYITSSSRKRSSTLNSNLPEKRPTPENRMDNGWH